MSHWWTGPVMPPCASTGKVYALAFHRFCPLSVTDRRLVGWSRAPLGNLPDQKVYASATTLSKAACSLAASSVIPSAREAAIRAGRGTTALAARCWAGVSSLKRDMTHRSGPLPDWIRSDGPGGLFTPGGG